MGPSEACTVSTVLAWGRGVLAHAGVDSPRLDSELLLAHALSWQRARLHVSVEHLLGRQERLRFAELLERRAHREPLPYIVGHQEFYGLDFFVDRRVLIPRPETELLVERAGGEGMRLLKSKGCLTLADVGTGCGAIAITLALQLSTARVRAIDVSAPALEIAADNCARHGVEGQVDLLMGDLLDPLSRPVDIIVANLPYVASTEVAALAPEISRYEPPESWDGGVGGLEVIERLLAQAGEHLSDGGSILLEIGATQGSAVQSVAANHLPAVKTEVLKDGMGLDRVVRIGPVLDVTTTRGGSGPCPA